jgi:signal peptidase I
LKYDRDKKDEGAWMKRIRKALNKTWHFIWKSDSVWSWLINIVLAFLIIKYILYPGLGIIFNTGFPIVAVVSGSMEHRIVSHNASENPAMCGITYDRSDYFVSFDYYWDTCGEWYEKRDITKEEFFGFLFKHGFNKGDIIFIYGKNTKDLKIGEVIVFSTEGVDYPIIHRIVRIYEHNGERRFITKGDHNKDSGIIDMNIRESDIMGAGVFRVPYMGWIKIWFVDLTNLIRGIGK